MSCRAEVRQLCYHIVAVFLCWSRVDFCCRSIKYNFRELYSTVHYYVACCDDVFQAFRFRKSERIFLLLHSGPVESPYMSLMIFEQLRAIIMIVCRVVSGEIRSHYYHFYYYYSDSAEYLGHTSRSHYCVDFPDFMKKRYLRGYSTFWLFCVWVDSDFRYCGKVVDVMWSCGGHVYWKTQKKNSSKINVMFDEDRRKFFDVWSEFQRIFSLDVSDFTLNINKFFKVIDYHVKCSYIIWSHTCLLIKTGKASRNWSGQLPLSICCLVFSWLYGKISSNPHTLNLERCAFFYIKSLFFLKLNVLLV